MWSEGKVGKKVGRKGRCGGWIGCGGREGMAGREKCGGKGKVWRERKVWWVGKDVAGREGVACRVMFPWMEREGKMHGGKRRFYLSMTKF